MCYYVNEDIKFKIVSGAIALQENDDDQSAVDFEQMNENLLKIFNSEHDQFDNANDWDSMFVEQFMQCTSGIPRGMSKQRNSSANGPH